MQTTPLNVLLIPAAAADLEAEKASSKMTTTDVTNRAIQFYHFLMEQERHGQQVCVRPQRRQWLRRAKPVTVMALADE